MKRVLPLILVLASAHAAFACAAEARSATAWRRPACAAEARSATAWRRPAQETKDGKGQLKIGVVDLKQCFDKDRYERIKELDKELRALAEKFAEELRSIQKKMQNLRTQIEGLTPELKAYWDKLGELKQAETELEFRKKYGKQQYLNRLIGLQIDVYNEIRRVVDIYAKDHHYDLILRVEEPNLEDEDPRTASQRIASRVVLYHGGSLDITEKVIKLLNEEYLKQRSGAVPAWTCPKCKKKLHGRVCPDCGTKRP